MRGAIKRGEVGSTVPQHVGGSIGAGFALARDGRERSVAVAWVRYRLSASERE
ncbi:MAG: hypothetical protein OXC19_09260 [Bryobacterales bacterium]|nr:hypothetical protein [Bryobacterales bacterium]